MYSRKPISSRAARHFFAPQARRNSFFVFDLYGREEMETTKNKTAKPDISSRFLNLGVEKVNPVFVNEIREFQPTK